MSEEAERLFERARSLEPEARTVFVDEACRENSQLRAELGSLLNQADAAEEFFELLAGSLTTNPLSSQEAGDRPSDEATSDLALPLLHTEPRVGTTIDHYRILSRIGRGGMGEVYRAHDDQLDRDVALKFLPPLSTRLDAEERLLLEARAAAALEHPNICSIHEIGQADDGRPFIAMALYEGETLQERLRQGPLPLEEAVNVATQIARGLAAAHARGIVHRDVKPGNVILGSDGTVRLLDFGLAQVADATLAASGMTPGTASYMSPEQARGEPLDTRTDLWSLGVVLYEMLTGTRPFQVGNDRALLGAILDEDPEPLSELRPGIPGPLARIVERLLQKEPESRYDSAARVLADLERALPSGRFMKGRAALLAGGTVAAVILLGALWLPGRGGESTSRDAASAKEPSIAVLPLTNLSGDPRDAALADGMTEELIAILARSGELRVIASTSVFPFKGPQTDVRGIAESLGVSNVLEGSLQKIDSRLRMEVRLVDARDGSVRWSQAYDREFEDVFAVQDEIARAVAGELDLRLKGGGKDLRHSTRNVAAYELYLRGNDPTLPRSESGARESLEYFKRAIAADSTYAAAYAGLALAYVRLDSWFSPGRPIPELHALAARAAEKAVALDDSLAEAHHALGRVRMAELDFPSARVEISRAIALDPTDIYARKSLATLHIWAERPLEALAEARRALEDDPLSPYSNVEVAHALFANRRYDDALAQLERIETIRPPLRFAVVLAALSYAQKGMWPKAIAVLRPQAEPGGPRALSLLGHTLARAGERHEANRILADLLALQQKGEVGAFEVAAAYAGLGDFDQAFIWLDKAVNDQSMRVQIMEPTFEDLRRDPRFERLKARLGLQKL